MSSVEVLMIGWELPPYHTGGLGEACLGLAKALTAKGVGITFVLPSKKDFNIDFMNLMFADITEVENYLKTYTTNTSYQKIFLKGEMPSDYMNGAMKYAEKIGSMIKNKKDRFDIVHAHDWMTYPAGMVAKKVLKKPMVAHVHATEFDRTGGNWPNEDVYQIEKKGFEEARKVMPVGGLMIKTLEDKYDVPSEKIDVVYNGIDSTKKDLAPALTPFKKLGYKIVLFFGRITIQKGPEYFVRAAKIVSLYNPKTIFVVGGSGDMQDYMMTEAARLKILDKFIFTVPMWPDEMHRLFQAADVYVMPSISEPFGIVALESVVNGTPVLVSKQSGVSEIMNHILKVDFWDIEETANKILAILKNKSLPNVLREESMKEVKSLTWARAADKVIGIYRELM